MRVMRDVNAISAYVPIGMDIPWRQFVCVACAPCQSASQPFFCPVSLAHHLLSVVLVMLPCFACCLPACQPSLWPSSK